MCRIESNWGSQLFNFRLQNITYQSPIRFFCYADCYLVKMNITMPKFFIYLFTMPELPIFGFEKTFSLNSIRCFNVEMNSLNFIVFCRARVVNKIELFNESSFQHENQQRCIHSKECNEFSHLRFFNFRTIKKPQMCTCVLNCHIINKLQSFFMVLKRKN